MKKFRSIKLYDGFSTCFRQWKADTTHCRFLHGYAVKVEVTFEGHLDHRNWVADFGIMNRSKHTIDGIPASQWMKRLFDHTVIISSDDPLLNRFQELATLGAIQLVIVRDVGCERFAEFILERMNAFAKAETDGRVWVTKVRVIENEKNSAEAIMESV